MPGPLVLFLSSSSTSFLRCTAREYYFLVPLPLLYCLPLPLPAPHLSHAHFSVVIFLWLQLTQKRAEEFYIEHKSKPFFGGLTEFMTSGPIYALVLQKIDAIASWRKLMGPTDSETARRDAPRSIRGLYGTDGRRNACHGSDSATAAFREGRFFFPRMFIEPPRDEDWVMRYIQDAVLPVLQTGLITLAKERPVATKSDALMWLSNWILTNNPAKSQRTVVGKELPPDIIVDTEKEFADAEHQAELKAQENRKKTAALQQSALGETAAVEA